MNYKHRKLDHSYLDERDEDTLGLWSGIFLLVGMVIVSIIIADVATGFNLHNILANASSGA